MKPVQLSHRDSRTLEATRKRAPNRVSQAKADLIYYSIHLVCIFGGKKYRNRGTGERACQHNYMSITAGYFSQSHSTIKQGCTAGINHDTELYTWIGNLQSSTEAKEGGYH